MWKWLTVAALAYGLTAVWFAMSPRGTALGRFLEMVELQQGWQDAGDVPEVITFEFPVPDLQTVPQTPMEVIQVAEGQHVLRWAPDPSQPVNVLAIPMRPDLARPSGIELRFRGEGIACIATGVKERDGSLYSRLHPVSTEWQQVRLDLAELRLEAVSEDENDRLDPGQLEGMFIAVLAGEALHETLNAVPQRMRQQLKRRLRNLGQVEEPYLELDDIGIMGQTGPGHDRPRPQPGEGDPPRDGPPGERPPHGGQPRSAEGEVTSVEGVDILSVVAGPWFSTTWR